MNHIRKFGQTAAKLGFTLIELSIVLVIIGLIVGGILVGQDLIKAAEIRATVSQLEKYSTAVNAFRSKYNGIPGDLLNASNFGFDTTRGVNNGNSVIESVTGDAGSFAGESSCFWDDLTFAGLINESLNQSAAGACGNAQTNTVLTTALPAAKMGRNNFIHVGSLSGVNYLTIVGVTALSTGFLTVDDLLTGAEAFQIDSKIDDGGPTAGSVQATIHTLTTSEAATAQTVATARNIFLNNDAATAAATGVCIAPGGIYNFTTSGGNDQSCILRIRAAY